MSRHKGSLGTGASERMFTNKMGRRDTERMQQMLNGSPVMSKELLRLICLANDGYETPELNDKLYLHFKGFHAIAGLEEYTKAGCIWLESNVLKKIENLDHLQELRALFLHQNMITKIENLQNLRSLVILNLSCNSIRVVEGLSGLPNLSTLNISKNHITTVGDTQHLAECKSLTNLDLSANHIDDVKVLDVLQQLPRLASLYLKGNTVVRPAPPCRPSRPLPGNSSRLAPLARDVLGPSLPRLPSRTFPGTAAMPRPSLPSRPPRCLPSGHASTALRAQVSNIKHYRKTLISLMPVLGFLDTRPIFEPERVGAEAWKTGGPEAERAARRGLVQAKKDKEKAERQKYRDWKKTRREELKKARAEAEARGEAYSPFRQSVSYTRNGVEIDVSGGADGQRRAPKTSRAAGAPTVGEAQEFLGRKVRKNYEGYGLCEGVVRSYDDSAGRFRVCYTDGDWENLMMQVPLRAPRQLVLPSPVSPHLPSALAPSLPGFLASSTPSHHHHTTRT